MKTTLLSLVMGLSLFSTLTQAAYVDANQVAALGKVNFYECNTTFTQRLNMSLGVAERSEVFDSAIKNNKCVFVTDLKNATVISQLNDKDFIFSINRITIREEFDGTSRPREWFSCDLEDDDCMNEVEGIDKYAALPFRDDSAVGIKLNNLQRESIKAKISKNRNNQGISVYFFKEEVGHKVYRNDRINIEFWYDLEDSAIRIK